MATYTQRAEMVFQLAKNAAKEFKHAEVYPVHILLGLLQERSGLTASVLRNRGLSEERVKTAISAHDFEEGVGYEPDLPWTDVAQYVSTMAAREADMLGHNYVGTEHILLAMTKIEANQWLHLASTGALAGIRQEVLNLLGYCGEEKPTHEEILAKVFAIRDAVEQLAKDLQEA